MMKHFKGKLSKTRQTKNEPIKQGHKFFAMCNISTRFTWDMTPDGQLKKSAMHDMVFVLARMPPGIANPAKTCIIRMDNCFRGAKVLKSLIDVGIGVIGTARHQRGWLPKSCKDIKDDRFDTAHAMNDVNNCKIIWWVDNDVVNVMSNIHKGDEVVTSVQ